MIFSRPRLNKNLTLLNNGVPPAAKYPNHLENHVKVEYILLWEIIKIPIRRKEVIVWTFKSLPWKTYRDSINAVKNDWQRKRTLPTTSKHEICTKINWNSLIFCLSGVNSTRIIKSGKKAKMPRQQLNLYFDVIYEDEIPGNGVKYEHQNHSWNI